MDKEWANGWCQNKVGIAPFCPDADTRYGQTYVDDPMWDIACNISSPLFGSTKLKFDEENGKLVEEEGNDSLDSANYVGPSHLTVLLARGRIDAGIEFL